MLEQIYYIVIITFGIMGIIFLLTITLIIFKLYQHISALIRTAQHTAGEVSSIINDLGERGSDLLRLTTKEGQQAIKTSTLLSAAMNSYFFLRTIFGHRQRK